LPELVEGAGHEVTHKAFAQKNVDVAAFQALNFPQLGKGILAVGHPLVLITAEI